MPCAALQPLSKPGRPQSNSDYTLQGLDWRRYPKVGIEVADRPAILVPCSNKKVGTYRRPRLVESAWAEKLHQIGGLRGMQICIPRDWRHRIAVSPAY